MPLESNNAVSVNGPRKTMAIATETTIVNNDKLSRSADTVGIEYHILVSAKQETKHAITVGKRDTLPLSVTKRLKINKRLPYQPMK